MLNLLFATDFDKDAPKMFEYATLFAQTFGSKITMFHAYGNGELLTKKEQIERGEWALETLHDFVKDNLPVIRRDISFEYIVEDKFAYEAIPEVAADENIDVVIMGRKKGDHSWDVLLGNTTLEILLKLNCAVLVFPEGFKTSYINRLGCTTNFEFRDIALINMLREMGKNLDKEATIHCLHVFEQDSEKEDRVRKDMETLYWVFDKRKGTKVHFETESGKLADTIEAFALNHDLDLLVMNSHQRDFIGRILARSTSKEVAMDIQVPLLILKDM